MRKANIVFLISGIFVLLFFGCVTNEFNSVQKSIEKEIYPADMKTHFKLSLGSIMLFPLKTIVHLIDTEDEIDSYLDNIGKIQVGIYKIKNNKTPRGIIFKNVEKKINDLGWETFIRVRDKKSTVNLFYKLIDEQNAGLFAVILDDNRLIIAEIKGELDQIIEKAIREHSSPLKDMLR